MTSIILYGSMTPESLYPAQISLLCSRLVSTQWKYYSDIPFWHLKIKSSSEPPRFPSPSVLSISVNSTTIHPITQVWNPEFLLPLILNSKDSPGPAEQIKIFIYLSLFPLLWFRPPKYTFSMDNDKNLSLQTMHTAVRMVFLKSKSDHQVIPWLKTLLKPDSLASVAYKSCENIASPAVLIS